jgi:hypothetical protein
MIQTTETVAVEVARAWGRLAAASAAAGIADAVRSTSPPQPAATAATAVGRGSPASESGAVLVRSMSGEAAPPPTAFRSAHVWETPEIVPDGAEWHMWMR